LHVQPKGDDALGVLCKVRGIYERVERLMGRGPFLELFASGSAPHRDNWTRWIRKDRPATRRWKSDSHPGADSEPEPPMAA
jgi:hypothetical protein